LKETRKRKKNETKQIRKRIYGNVLIHDVLKIFNNNKTNKKKITEKKQKKKTQNKSKSFNIRVPADLR
jgi:hypothetical protein